jgi:hypothetical protein
MIAAIACIIILVGSLATVVHNYSFWRTHRDKETLLWIINGIVSAVIAIALLVLQYVNVSSIDATFVSLLKAVLFCVGLAGWVVLGIRSYVYGK